MRRGRARRRWRDRKGAQQSAGCIRLLRGAASRLPAPAGGRRQRRLAIQAVEQPTDVGLESLAVIRRDRRAGDELLAEGIHEAAVLDNTIVEVRARGEAGGPDPADHLTLAHPLARADVESRQVVVHRLVTARVPEGDAESVAAR